MDIERVNEYSDPRFSQSVLNQHGCFLADGEPYEVEIISQREAVIRGQDAAIYPEIIEQFRFFTPHITVFYDEKRNIVTQFSSARLIEISLADIQPSQFYVDRDKVDAIQSFIHGPSDIIIQMLRKGERYISLDGHTRLYYAAAMGWEKVYAVETESDDSIFDFVDEAIRRKVHSPRDLKLLSHQEYEEKWNKFCDDYFSQK